MGTDKPANMSDTALRVLVAPDDTMDTRVAEAERDPWAALTKGTGQLIVAVAQAGARKVLVAVGARATTGVDADMVRCLTCRLHTLAAAAPRDPCGREMTGAAGGLSGGMSACWCGAELVDGARCVLDTVSSDRVDAPEVAGVHEATTLEGLETVAREIALRDLTPRQERRRDRHPAARGQHPAPGRSSVTKRFRGRFPERESARMVWARRGWRRAHGTD